MDGSFLKRLEEIKKAKHARQYPNVLETACMELVSFINLFALEHQNTMAKLKEAIGLIKISFIERNISTL